MINKEKYEGIDYFRIIAALFVVIIHTSPLGDVCETADFILTRVLARVAVPFFFMVSGLFLFSEKENNLDRLLSFIKKTSVIYGIACLIYLPINIYSGTAGEWIHLSSFLKDILFDGTFFHLWYLPASVMGACIGWLLLKKLRMGQALFISMVLYIFGLFGDSYYGIVEYIPFLKSLYRFLFLFSDFTRNGLFYAPVFLLLGGFLGRKENIKSVTTGIIGFAVSIILMVLEALLIRDLKLQRHDSMYFLLLPCMYFFFSCLLMWKGKEHKNLRSLSLIIYLIHPAVIVAIRGIAKATRMQILLIENSIMHFLAVTVVSLAISICAVVLLNMKSRDKATFIGGMDRAWAEIDLANLRHNAIELQDKLPSGCKIMAVVKANAYGHGAVSISACLNSIGIKTFAVATIEEGIQLRKSGINGEILILGYTPATRALELVQYCLSQTVTDVEHAKELNLYDKPIRIHIKVETGMNRLGESYKHVSEIASIFDCKNLNVAGIYTHLCVSDSLEKSNVAFTYRQIQKFYCLLDKLKERNIKLPAIHIQSSYGVLNYPELVCDYARTGIALYGVLSTLYSNIKLSLDLRPVLSLKSQVALTKTIAAGESVGYGRSFVACKEMKIAIIPIGYADGLPRSLSSKGNVLLNGHKAPILGRICMDQLIVDVTEIPNIKRGDIVTLIGKDGLAEITAEQVAFDSGTITNELLCKLNDSRLNRIYLKTQ